MIANGAKPALVATYPYRDEDDALLYESLRYDPKDFRQRRPDGRGGYVWNLKGVRRVPYRLPELLSGIAKKQTVFIVEGEKDAETLRALGFIATTSAGGSGWPWPPEFAECFRGALCVVAIADCDEHGRRAALARAALVCSVVADVRTLDIAPDRGDGYDVSDWIADGHTADELRALVAQAKCIGEAPSTNGKVHSAPDVNPQEPVNLAELLDDVVAFIRQYVVVSTQQLITLALWVAHTHAFDAAETTPYIAITSSAMGSGKTRLLETLELLVRNPWMTARATAAALCRKVDKEAPTLLFDELDATFKGDKETAEATRGILNSGYNSEGRSTVCVGQGANIDTRDLRTFCPKALAGIGKLPDTVRDRSIIIELERKIAGEEASRFRRKHVKPQAAPLRAALVAWARPAIESLSQSEPTEIEGISDRAADCWEPLLAIAEQAGEEWSNRARNAAVRLSGSGAEAPEDSPRAIRLLSDIRDVFDALGKDRLKSEALARELSEIEESLWGADKGKPFNAHALARELRPWKKIRPKQIRFSESESVKGYMRSAFEDAWKRYLPKPSSIRNARNNPNSTGVSDDSSAATAESRFETETGGKPFGTSDVSVVSENAANPENGGVTYSNQDEPNEEPGGGIFL